MTQKQLDMAKELEGRIMHVIGPEKAKNIIVGIEKLKPSTNKLKLAEWVKGTMEKLDASVDESKRVEIMDACGKKCATINKKAIDMFTKRVKKFPTLETFLDAEEKNPMKGTKIKREGDAIIHIYAPQTYTHPMRCFCGLVNGLPDEQLMSKTYCHCSKALVTRMWEAVTGKNVIVEILQTALSGASECHFKIYLK